MFAPLASTALDPRLELVVAPQATLLPKTFSVAIKSILDRPDSLSVPEASRAALSRTSSRPQTLSPLTRWNSKAVPSEGGDGSWCRQKVHESPGQRLTLRRSHYAN